MAVTKAQQITRFIYNHHWVHALMKKFTEGEILRPGITRFATNFIALKSIQQRKMGLKAMFTSSDWMTSRFSSSADGKTVEKFVLSSRFWESVAEIIVAIETLYVVLRHVDMEKRPQMGYVYQLIHTAREEIRKALPDTRSDPFICIIDRRWDTQMSRDLHMAGNIKFHKLVIYF